MCGFPADFSVKKIEAIINPAALDAVKLHLAQAGIDGRLTVTEVSGLEIPADFINTNQPLKVLGNRV